MGVRGSVPRAKTVKDGRRRYFCGGFSRQGVDFVVVLGGDVSMVV